MAMTVCKDCGGEISTEAQACPKCGALVKKSPSNAAVVLVVLIAGGLLVSYLSSSPAPDAPPPTSPGQAAAEPAAPKGKLTCYEEPGTRKSTCIDEHAVAMNGGVRASPLYSGGPNSVRKTPYLVVADCGRGVLTLQDKDGVNFSGGFSGATDAAELLTRRICAAKPTSKAPKLRQF